MRSRAVIILAAFIACATMVEGQKTPQAPKPGPEVAKLGYFLGDWKLDTELKLNRSAPGGKFVSTTHNEWIAGGFFLAGQAEQNSIGSTGKTLTIFGYDPAEKTYTYWAFTNVGRIELAKGTVEGNIWTWTSESKVEDQVFHGRLVIETVSPASYRFKYEMASEQGRWSTIMEGTATKTK